jgi:hypothetical protein
VIEQVPEPGSEDSDRISRSRLQLVWDVLIFQFKLAADGLRDVALVPVSLISGLLGLVAGGDDPGRYFRRVLHFGRRTEFWINLFGYRRITGTSDELIKPIQDKVFRQAEITPWVRKAGTSVNRSLDSLGGAIDKRRSKKQADGDPEGP